MMENIRDIKTRIKSVKSTKQITNAMKMVASSKLRKAQKSIINARPYADYINEILRILKYKNKQTKHPLLDDANQANGKKAIIVVTADKGLCGAFNHNIIRRAMQYISENPETDIICLGKKGRDHIKKRSDKIIRDYTDLFNEMDFTVSTEVGDFLLDLFQQQGYSKIEVIYNEFKSAIQQNIVLKQLLPVLPADGEDISSLDYIYEPDENLIIEELGRKYVHVDIWRIMLESSAAEQGARMTAMDSATENAAEMIEMLTLYYNRARQAAITSEIIEIASGAEAINN
jgi:F-type H+-transporting ATPase subunit gamma